MSRKNLYECDLCHSTAQAPVGYEQEHLPAGWMTVSAESEGWCVTDVHVCAQCAGDRLVAFLRERLSTVAQAPDPWTPGPLPVTPGPFGTMPAGPLSDQHADPQGLAAAVHCEPPPGLERPELTNEELAALVNELAPVPQPPKE